MELLKLFRIIGSSLEQLEFGDITPIQLKESHDLNVRTYLTVSFIRDGETKPTVKTIHLSLLFTETVIGKCATWDEVVNELTEVMVDSYTSKDLDIENPSKYLNQISVSNNLNLNMHYTTLKSPDLKDVPTLLWKLRDLSITQKEDTPKDERIDFNKCLCSINGLLTKPYVFNGELIVPEGMSFMLDSSDINWPDVVLLDFSTLADFTIIPLSECEHQILKPENGNALGCDIALTLPDVNLAGKSVMAVIGNTLILHDKLFVVDENTVHITPFKYPIHTNMLLKKKLEMAYIPNTDIYRTYEETLEQYVYTDMFKDDHEGAFLIVVDTPSLYISDLPIAPEDSGKKVRTHAPLGILRRRATWGIVDYVVREYNNVDILSISQAPNLFVTDDKVHLEQFGMDFFNCDHNETILNIGNSGYEMFRIVA